jgi:hypothetical protein
MIGFIKKLVPNKVDFAVGSTLAILKLTGDIDWHWLAVTGPFWLTPVLRAILFLAETVYGAIKGK